MDNSKRENLIQALAASVGAEGLKRTDVSRFNPDTGTLFCNGYVISRNTVEEARIFFEKQSQRCANASEKEVKSMAQLYTVAAEAIKMMQEGEFSSSAAAGDYQVIKK